MHAKHIIAVRKRHPALARGEIEFVEVEGGRILAFMREGEGERLLCVFNLSREEAKYALPHGAHPIDIFAGETARDGDMLTLSPRSAAAFTV